MYGITLGLTECPIFYDDRGERKFAFSLTETRAIIDSLLTKKARNNGVGRHLLSTLRLKGSCRYDFSRAAEPIAFYCKNAGDSSYAVTLLGNYPHELIGRLNRLGQPVRAIALTRAIRSRRRQLRQTAGYKDPIKQERPRKLAGESGRLKLHFRNSEISCADAIVVIAHAARFDRKWVRTRLTRSLDERAIASIRLKGGFVFRIDLAVPWQGYYTQSTSVQIRTTNDNTHGAYRRLRNALRKRLKRERKVRVIAQLHYIAAKKFQETALRLVV